MKGGSLSEPGGGAQRNFGFWVHLGLRAGGTLNSTEPPPQTSYRTTDRWHSTAVMLLEHRTPCIFSLLRFSRLMAHQASYKQHVVVAFDVAHSFVIVFESYRSLHHTFNHIILYI